MGQARDWSIGLNQRVLRGPSCGLSSVAWSPSLLPRPHHSACCLSGLHQTAPLVHPARNSPCLAAFPRVWSGASSRNGRSHSLTRARPVDPADQPWPDLLVSSDAPEPELPAGSIAGRDLTIHLTAVFRVVVHGQGKQTAAHQRDADADADVPKLAVTRPQSARQVGRRKLTWQPNCGCHPSRVPRLGSANLHAYSAFARSWLGTSG